MVPKNEPTFAQVLNQASRIISSLAGTILMFTLIGYGVHHYYPHNKWIVPGFVLIGIVLGFAILIKEAMTDPSNQ